MAVSFFLGIGKETKKRVGSGGEKCGFIEKFEDFAKTGRKRHSEAKMEDGISAAVAVLVANGGEQVPELGGSAACQGGPPTPHGLGFVHQIASVGVFKGNEVDESVNEFLRSSK